MADERKDREDAERAAWTERRRRNTEERLKAERIQLNRRLERRRKETCSESSAG